MGTWSVLCESPSNRLWLTLAVPTLLGLWAPSAMQDQPQPTDDRSRMFSGDLGITFSLLGETTGVIYRFEVEDGPLDESEYFWAWTRTFDGEYMSFTIEYPIEKSYFMAYLDVWIVEFDRTTGELLMYENVETGDVEFEVCDFYETELEPVMAENIVLHLEEYEDWRKEGDESASPLDDVRAKVAAGREIKDPTVRAFIESLE